MLFEDCELRLYATRFADVRILRQTVVRRNDIRSQAQSSPSLAPVRPWGLGLQPVEKRQTQLSRPLEITRRICRTDFKERAKKVIIHRPVDQGDVAHKRSRYKIRLVDDAPVHHEVKT